MPATSSSKKTDSNQNKKVTENTPVRISNRVRKEKFSVKELFNSRDRDISSDEEVTHRKKVSTASTSKVTNVQVVKASCKSFLRSETAKVSKSITAKPLNSNSPKILSVTQKTLANLGKNSEIKTGILRKSSVVTSKTSSLKTQDVASKTKSKEDDILDPILSENIKLEPIFNQDNIEAVLENPSSLGLDIVVTKLSEADQTKELECKKSKNVVTIAKVTGSTPASKPIKVVPMKPGTPDVKNIELKSPTSSVLKSSLNSSLIIEKKKVNSSSAVKSGQVKEVKVNRQLCNESVVPDRPYTSKFVENKRQVKPLETRSDKSCDFIKSNKRSLLLSDNLKLVQEESEKRLNELQDDILEERVRNPCDFEKYFSISVSYIEHNDSLDEESNDEDTYLSHFFEKETRVKRSRYSDGEDLSIYELMFQINCEYPSWNLHVTQDNNTYLICQVTRGARGLPLMNKTIELNENLTSAKIYINEIIQKEVHGSFDNYESMRQLISTAQQM